MFKKFVYRNIDEKLSAYKRVLFENVCGDVLEVGAGFGNNIPYLVPMASSLTIVEPNEKYLEETKKQFSSYEFNSVRGVGENLPFADNSFDTVVATLCLCSVDNVQKTLSEIRRVLRSDGAFIFLEHVAEHQKVFTKYVQKVLRPVQWRVSHCDLRRDTMQAIRDARFDITESKIIRDGFLWPATPVVLGKAL